MLAKLLDKSCGREKVRERERVRERGMCRKHTKTQQTSKVKQETGWEQPQGGHSESGATLENTSYLPWSDIAKHRQQVQARAVNVSVVTNAWQGTLHHVYVCASVFLCSLLHHCTRRPNIKKVAMASFLPNERSVEWGCLATGDWNLLLRTVLPSCSVATILLGAGWSNTVHRCIGVRIKPDGGFLASDGLRYDLYEFHPYAQKKLTSAPEVPICPPRAQSTVVNIAHYPMHRNREQHIASKTTKTKKTSKHDETKSLHSEMGNLLKAFVAVCYATALTKKKPNPNFHPLEWYSTSFAVPLW